MWTSYKGREISKKIEERTIGWVKIFFAVVWMNYLYEWELYEERRIWIGYKTFNMAKLAINNYIDSIDNDDYIIYNL